MQNETNKEVHRNFGVTIDKIFNDNKSLEANVPELKKVIRNMQEFALILNSQRLQEFPDFAEEKVLQLLMDLIKRTEYNKEIVLAVIETLNMLIVNISDEKYLSLILSGLPQFITLPYDFSQEEIIDYYINLLKILSQRISNEKYLVLYFNQTHNYFPLLWESSRFFNRRDNMINTTARNIFLNILKGKKSEKYIWIFDKYLTSLPFQIMVTNYILDFKQCCLEAGQHLIKKNKGRLLDHEDRMRDYICFIHDLRGIQKEIKKLVDNALLEFAILPCILNGLIDEKKSDVVSGELGLNILYVILENLENDQDKEQEKKTTPPLKDELIVSEYFEDYQLKIQQGDQEGIPTLRDALIYLLTSRQLTPELQNYQTRDPFWYNKEWQPKTYWDSNLDYLKQKCEFIFSSVDEEQETKAQNVLIGVIGVACKILKKKKKLKESLGSSISKFGFSLIKTTKQKLSINPSTSEEIEDLERKLGLASESKSLLEIIQIEIQNLPSQSIIQSSSDLKQSVKELKKNRNPFLEQIFLNLRVKNDTLVFSSLNFLSYLIQKNYIDISFANDLSQRLLDELLNIIKTQTPLQEQTLFLVVNLLYQILSQELLGSIQLKEILLQVIREFRIEVCKQDNYNIIYKEFVLFYEQAQKKDITAQNVNFDFQTIFQHQTTNIETNPCRQRFKLFSYLILLWKSLNQDWKFELFADLNPLKTIQFNINSSSFYACKIIEDKNQQTNIQINLRKYLTIYDYYIYLVQETPSNYYQVLKSYRLNQVDIFKLFSSTQQILLEDVKIEINVQETCEKFKQDLQKNLVASQELTISIILNAFDNLKF